MHLSYFILLALGLGAVVFVQWLGYKERKSLLDRIMANSYKEYSYYDKQFNKELNELGAIRGEARRDRETLRGVGPTNFATEEIDELGKKIDTKDWEESWEDEGQVK